MASKDTKKSNKRNRSQLEVKQRSELEEKLFGANFGKKLEQYDNDVSDEDNSEEEKKGKIKKIETKTIAPAWVDEDDKNVVIQVRKENKDLLKSYERKRISFTGEEYANRVREKFVATSNPEWSQFVLDDTDEFLRSNQPILQKADVRLLDPTTISAARISDLNHSNHSKSRVTTIDFHPSGDFAAIGSNDRKLRLFEVDGKNNPHLQTVVVDMTLRHAKFCNQGNEIALCGRNSFAYIFDIASGKLEQIEALRRNSLEISLIQQMVVSSDNKYIAYLHDWKKITIISQNTRQWICDFILGKPCSSIDFSPNSNNLYAAGQGEVFVWDMHKRACSRRYTDYGADSSDVIKNCPRGLYQAIGSKSGVVNVYRTNEDFTNTSTPKPLKEIMNITSMITHIQFNKDSQLMAIASTHKSRALRLVHLPSCTVYQKFPPVNVEFTLSSLAFSPDSSKLIAGTTTGQAVTFSLRHYEQIF